jgi:hypothetical protein
MSLIPPLLKVLESPEGLQFPGLDLRSWNAKPGKSASRIGAPNLEMTSDV